MTGDIRRWIAPLHRAQKYLDQLKSSSIKTYSINPVRPETSKFLENDWIAPKPGTDTALMLALMHELIAAGMANKSFLDKYTFGFDALKNYILCSTDGVEKNAEWAGERNRHSSFCHSQSCPRFGNSSDDADDWLGASQRARYGEQFPWMAYALACVLGQIGFARRRDRIKLPLPDGGVPVRKGKQPRGISSKVAPVWPLQKAWRIFSEDTGGIFRGLFLESWKGY